jgi:hypothetical protein
VPISPAEAYSVALHGVPGGGGPLQNVPRSLPAYRNDRNYNQPYRFDGDRARDADSMRRFKPSAIAVRPLRAEGGLGWISPDVLQSQRIGGAVSSEKLCRGVKNLIIKFAYLQNAIQPWVG